MRLLQAVSSLHLPQWCIAAGVIRNKVWDYLHDYADRTEPSDIDMLFFDRERTGDCYQTDIEQRFSALMPGLKWEAMHFAHFRHQPVHSHGFICSQSPC